MSANVVTVYGIDLAIDAERVPSLLSSLGPVARERAAAFHAAGDRSRFVAAHAGLARALAAHLGVPPESLALDAPAQQKPALPDMPGTHFNLTHSADLALVAITSNAPVGVDIEKIRTLDDRDDVAREVFGTAEQAALARVPDAAKTVAFFNAWTRKEAIIKATGEGFSADLKHIAVTLTPGAPATVNEYPRLHQWQLFAFTPVPGYVAAVALESGDAVQLDWRGVVF